MVIMIHIIIILLGRQILRTMPLLVPISWLFERSFVGEAKDANVKYVSHSRAPKVDGNQLEERTRVL